MSLVFAVSVPGVAIIASERKWSVSADNGTTWCSPFDGPSKLLALPNGFAAAGGDAAAILSAYAALPDGPVTPPQLAQEVTGDVYMTAVLAGTDGTELVSIEAPEGRWSSNPFGYFCAPPYERDDVRALAVEAAGEMQTMATDREIITRIARLFMDSAALCELSGEYMDVGILANGKMLYLHGPASTFADPARIRECYAHAPSVHTFLTRHDAVLRPQWTVSSAVDEVWLYARTLAVGEELGDIETGDHLLDVLIPDANRRVSYTFDVPPEGFTLEGAARTYHVEDERYFWGFADNFTIYPAPDQAPVIRTEDFEDGETGTFWIEIQERGIAVTNVQVQTRVATGALSALTTPARDSGDASTVQGGVLASGEYEHDVALDTYRQSWIYYVVTLETGEVLTVPSPGFDRDRRPDFSTAPSVAGTEITVNGDADTLAFQVTRVDGGGTWSADVDTWNGTVDVGVADVSANPGLTSGEGIYRVILYSDPIDDIDGDTLARSVDVSVVVSASGEPVWESVTLTPPSVGSDIATATLDADSAPPGYTAALYWRAQEGGGSWSDWALASTTPALSTPPTSATAYTIDTGYTRVAKDVSLPIVSYEIKAEIETGAGVVVDTETAERGWYISGV